jgi:Na+-driven multidrug efflux pump
MAGGTHILERGVYWRYEFLAVQHVGAGRIARAQRSAWIGTGLAAAVTGSVGLFGACFLSLWLRLFSTHPEVLAAGTSYLCLVGPTHSCFGLGLALYFASQGAGRLLWPLVAGGAWLALAAGGRWMASARFGSSLTAMYIAIAAAFVIYAASMMGAIKASTWQDMQP